MVKKSTKSLEIIVQCDDLAAHDNVSMLEINYYRNSKFHELSNYIKIRNHFIRN